MRSLTRGGAPSRVPHATHGGCLGALLPGVEDIEGWLQSEEVVLNTLRGGDEAAMQAPAPVA